MICARCDQPILPGQPYTVYDVHSNSGPGHVVHLHTQPCERTPTQTRQGPRW